MKAFAGILPRVYERQGGPSKWGQLLKG